MIPIDSKSYPYLAVAQHYKLNYGSLLLNDRSVIEQYQKDWNASKIVIIENKYEGNVFAREIWNAAIEKAAEVVKHSGYLEQVRKLKV
jgi:hypothetical protein